MQEIMMIRTKKGWKAYDRRGNSIEAPTKEMARLQYYKHYVQPDNMSNLFDIPPQKEVKCEHL